MDNREQADRERREERRCVEREARSRRGQDLAGALAGLDGGAHLRGASPTPIITRTLLELDQWLERRLPAGDSLVRAVLRRHLEGMPELLTAHAGDPAALLATWLPPLLASPARLQDLVRELDMAWGQREAERPFFEAPGRPPHPEDPYTIEGVARLLTDLLGQARRQR